MSIKQLASLFLVLLTSTMAAGASDWDVSDTGQPFIDVEFAVTEGTWMSVAVSPDGGTLVFDLLGDIYGVPVSGGDARLLHGGPAMQRTPRFSPDGTQLLFVSDAGGSDNLWVSNSDGSHPRPITDAEPHILAGPAWGPKGDYVAATKSYATFPETRSSEIRLFHLKGGGGRVLVETPVNQRDVQEANFSLDGRFLYYTQKVATPNIFVDANHINHAIMRRDFQTGETEELVSGFGGATSPHVSPDGRLVAFVRRVKDKTVLFVYNLETRVQRPVYDALDRDAQADFVPHGSYYPQFDWFPDNLHIAAWGKGKLYKINTRSGLAAEIPFRVAARHRITRTLRFSQDLIPDRVMVRAIRQPTISPDERHLVFNALGRLWRQAFPSGQPQRITTSVAYEFDPAHSPDGRKLAYVEWDDERGSALNVVVPTGGGARTLVQSSGVIRRPVFSPDGEMIAYRIEAGSKVMGGYRTRPGLYWVPANGGDSHFVTEKGESPRFSPDGQRLFYSILASDDEVIYATSVSVNKLESVNLNGFDVREHVVGADTSELTISPDFRWVAFKQHQQYQVMPFLETGVPLRIDPKNSEVPTRTLTENGGDGLTWSTDSQNLYWTLGPDVFRASPSVLFSSDRVPLARYASIDLSVPADEPEGTLAFTGARVITMRGEEVIESGTVVVTGSRIVAVGPSSEIAVPQDALTIDLDGKTMMPGLVNMHGHIDCCYGDGLTPQKQPMRYAALAFGVTTNFDPYSTELPNYSVAEMSRAGISVSPRFIGSGRVIYGRTGKPDFTYTPINDYDDARRVMLRKSALGGTIIKSYKQPMRRQRQQLVKAAREAGIMVDAEGENHFYNDITMILDGHTALEHNLPVATYYEDVVKLMAHGNTAHTPTLIVTFAEIFGENYLYQTTRPWEDARVQAFVMETTSSYSPLTTPFSAPPHVRGMTALHAADEIYDIGFRSVARSMRKLDDAGVLVNVGSHGQIAGLAMHWEMWLLAEGGMSNHRVLRAATLNGASTLGLEGQIGSVEPGKLADLIILDKNPLDDIRHSSGVRYTVLNGRLYDSLSMNEIGNYDRPRTRFYWELEDYQGIDWNQAWSGQ